MTETSEECLGRWMHTLATQMTLIGHFFDHARSLFPGKLLPMISVSRPKSSEDK
jgi:hypothetical protein